MTSFATGCAVGSPWIAGGSHDYANRGRRKPASGGVLQVAADRGLEQRNEIAAHPVHQRLRLGIAQPHVKLENLGFALDHHQARIEEPRERAALPPQVRAGSIG